MSEAPSPPREPDPSVTVRSEGVSDVSGLPAAGFEVPTLEAPQLYRPLSLLAVGSLVLGVAYSLLILVGGLLPFARAWPRGFLVLLVLGPILGGLGAVLTRQKSTERIATIAALSLAAVFVLIGLGGLIYFSAQSPWEPGVWAWLLLFAALLVSVLALAQIRAAEGALAGRNLARCGLYLGLFFGGFYVIYVAANQFAVSNQAQTAADSFINLIREDKLPEAFVKTIKPNSRPEGQGDKLLLEIEQGFNAPMIRDPGPYSGFCTSQLVQQLRHSKNAKVTCIGVAPEFTPQGYLAKVRYRVDTEDKLDSFEVYVGLQSVDAQGRREWQINWPECRAIPSHPQESPLLRKVDLAKFDSNFIAKEWLTGLSTKQPEVAYLLALPADQRTPLTLPLLTSRSEVVALVGAAAAGAVDKERQALAAGKDEFVNPDEHQETNPRTQKKGKYAGFVDDSQLKKATDAETCERLKQEVIRFFSNSNRTPVTAELLLVVFPNVTDQGNEIEVGRPVRFNIEPSGKEKGMFVEGEIVCRGKLSALDSPLDRYRVVGVKLIRVSIAPGPGAPPPRGP